MAKYDVTFSCGHKGTVQLMGKTADRERKLARYANNGLCPECYKAKKLAEEAEKPITIHITPMAAINSENGEPLFCIWLDGNTRPSKDAIKAAGFCWDIVETDLLSEARGWQCKAERSEIDDIVNAAKSLGGVLANDIENALTIAASGAALQMSKKWHARQAQIDAIPRPSAPAVVKGHRWNQKIYGKKGNYSIYYDGVKTAITDDEAVELEAYLKAKAEYRAKVAEIK